jgi:hypothetical protein
MKYTLDQGIDELKKELAKNKLIIFVGSGVSIDPPSGLPTWDGLIDEFIGFCRDIQNQLPSGERFDALLDDALDKKGRYPIRVATVLRDKLRSLEKAGHHSISSRFTMKFQRIFYAGHPNVNHASIVKTSYPYILTTNYDLLLEDAAKDANISELLSNSYTFLKPELLASRIYEEKPAIIHLHGNALDIALDDFVFTVDDYQRIKKRHPGFTLAVQTLFLKYCILFVGYGASDPHWEDFIEDLSYAFNWASYPTFPLRYFLVLKQDKAGEVMEKYKHKVRTEIIIINDYPEITKLLTELQNFSPR